MKLLASGGGISNVVVWWEGPLMAPMSSASLPWIEPAMFTSVLESLKDKAQRREKLHIFLGVLEESKQGM